MQSSFKTAPKYERNINFKQTHRCHHKYFPLKVHAYISHLPIEVITLQIDSLVPLPLCCQPPPPASFFKYSYISFFISRSCCFLFYPRYLRTFRLRSFILSLPFPSKYLKHKGFGFLRLTCTALFFGPNLTVASFSANSISSSSASSFCPVISAAYRARWTISRSTC